MGLPLSKMLRISESTEVPTFRALNREPKGSIP